MPDEIAVKLRLAMTVVADGIVKIDQAFARHELMQTAHEFVGTLRVDTEVSASKREQNRQVRLAYKNGVQIDPGLVLVPQT